MEITSTKKMDWPPVSSDHQVPQERRSGKTLDKTGKLCIESCCSVTILVTVLIAALVGQSESKPNY